jgi:hypothetical protein
MMAFEGYKKLLAAKGQTAQVGTDAASKLFEMQKYNDLLALKQQEQDYVVQKRQGQEFLASVIPDLIAQSKGDPNNYMQNLATVVQSSPVPLQQDDIVQSVNLFKPYVKKEATPKSATDLGNFVGDGVVVYKAQNPDASAPEVAAEKKRLALQFKRAQAPEVAGTTRAKAVSDFDVKETNAVYTAAKDAKKQLVKIDETIKQLNESDAITGFGANFLKGIERIKAKVGSDAAKGVVVDTQYLDALMGSEVFAMIKALGVGARGLDTPAEREFMRQVITGELPMEKGTIMKMAQFRKQAALESIDEYRKFEDAGAYKDSRLPRLDFGGGRQVVRTGRTKDGRKVVEYSDGTREVQ